jgi:integrase
MPALAPNVRIFLKALAGPPAVYAIQRHPGLYLAVLGNGRGSWRIRYRPYRGGTQRWHTLSRDARNSDFNAVAKKAAELLTNLQLNGIDPKAAQERAEHAHTFDVVFGQWLDHTGPGRRRALSTRTRAEYQRLYSLHLKSRIGRRPIADLNHAEIEAAIKSVYATTNDPNRGQRGLQATKAAKLIGGVFRFCVSRELLQNNPVRRMDWLPSEQNPLGKQSRPLNEGELRELWLSIDREMPARHARLLRVAILTGRRISELVGAKPQDVNLDAPIPHLVIPANRVGNKAKRDDAVPLAPLALAIVKEALATSDGQSLFGVTGRHGISIRFMRFARKRNWPGRTRLHDLRSLINDQLSLLGVSTEIRSRTLHHTGDLRQLVNTTYSAFDFLQARLDALSAWETRLLSIVAERCELSDLF